MPIIRLKDFPTKPQAVLGAPRIYPKRVYSYKKYRSSTPRRKQALKPILKPLPRHEDELDSHKRRLFDALIDNALDRKAAVLSIYPMANDKQVRLIARRLLKDRDIRAVMKIYAIKSVQRVEDLAETASSEKVRLDANLAILDRAGFAVPKEQHTTNNLIIQIPEALAKKNRIQATPMHAEVLAIEEGER